MKDEERDKTATPAGAGRPCVFFDRDGIVNQAPGDGYVLSWEEFHLLPEFVETLRTVRGLGYEAVVVSNQRCVARGLISDEAMRAMHQRLRRVLDTDYHLNLLDVVFCPHHPDTCDCRKPLPGMLLQAARRHGLDLAASWMVGDQERDIEAGRHAGCRTVLVGGKPDGPTRADVRVADMAELTWRIETILNERGGE